MNQEYDRRESPSGRVSVRMNGGKSSARYVRESELTEAERRRKDAETGDTDNRYIEMLCDRYRDRGIAGRAHADAVRQQKQEALTKAQTPGAYVMAEQLSRTDGMDQYRSGVQNGRRYMTVADYDHYYHDQRDFRFPERRAVGTMTGRHDPAELLAETPAVTAEVLPPKKAGWLTDTDKLPAFVKRWLGKPFFRRLNEWAGETFPRENHMVKADRKPHAIPAGVVAGLVVVAVSMSLVISGTVLVSQSTREVSELKDTLAEAQAIRSELSDQLDLKNDLLGIKDIAVDQLGMVGEEYLTGQYLDSRQDDYLEVYGDGTEREQSGWAAILSAFGFGRD